MIIIKNLGNEERMIVAVDNEVWALVGSPACSCYLYSAESWAVDGFDTVWKEA
jgi:hypothetical protein